MEDPPVVEATVNALVGGFKEMVVKCPFCGHEHRHIGTGPHLSHCADLNRAEMYIIKEKDA